MNVKGKNIETLLTLWVLFGETRVPTSAFSDWQPQRAHMGGVETDKGVTREMRWW